MEYSKPTLEELQFCMKDPRCIRNVCILAHVDHGKTTLADLLLTTNRLVSKRMAGLLRYLDDRSDEQERGITMKSSAVSLLNLVFDDDIQKNRTILLNLVDTPGHIDFASEVGAALRVSDGAIILVDIVEGVCVQTRESISKAFEERAKMILIINKIDKLIVDLEKNSNDIFQCILRIIEGCNAIIAELYKYEFTDTEVDIEDTGLLFTPPSGNIIFASALDGWGFTTKQIAQMFLGFVQNETVDSLNSKMWDFDCFIDSKKEIKKGAIDKRKTNIFEQLCIKTLEFIYQTIIVRMDKDKIPVILQKLNISNSTREMTNHNDPKVQLKAIMSAWKPLGATILLQCLKIVPSPSQIDKSKIEYLLNKNQYTEDPYLNNCVENMISYFEKTNSESPTIAYVSKMFCVHKKNLSQNASKQILPKPRDTENKVRNIEQEKEIVENSLDIQDLTEDIFVIALSRVFTGTLKVGQEIYCLRADYIPSESKETFDSHPNVSKTIIKKLYMLCGRELVSVESIPAGNICGIGGIEANVLRTATLSTDLNIVPFVEHPSLTPVIRHALEPLNPKDLPLLRKGLKLLMHSDPCVQVLIQESGEHVLVTAGDVHLDKCIEDLTSKFVKIRIQVSSPMVPLRETVNTNLSENIQPVCLKTNNILLSLIIVPLPPEIVEGIASHHKLLKTIEEQENQSLIDLIKKITDSTSDENQSVKEKIFKSRSSFVKEQLKNSFQKCGSLWSSLYDKIWSVSKISDCFNLLINDTEDYIQNLFLETHVHDKRTLFTNCIVNQFHNFCKAGPLCEEPLTNCAFIVKEFKLARTIEPEEITPQLMSSEESAIRGLMKNCFENQEQRLMEPIYTTSIQVNTNILGKVYTVINKRHGKVLEAVGMDEKEKSFLVQAQIPVVESDGFANEIRSTTSGQANPNLRFSHYEIIDGDPFYEFVNEADEDDEQFKVDSALRASKLRKDVRRRKGLQVEDEVVVHAEKQRTLNKKK